MGIFVTYDAGNSWARITDMPNVAAIAVDPTTALIIWAGRDSGAGVPSLPQGPGGLLKSSDGGMTWVPVTNGPAGTNVYSIAIDPRSPSTAYAGTAVGIFKTTDGGATWVGLNNGIPAFTDIVSIALSPSSPSTVYAGNGFKRRGVYRSTDGGASWSLVNGGLVDADVRALAVHPNDSTVAYRGDYSVGIARTDDGGAHWDLVNETRGVRAVAIAPSSPYAVYVGLGAQEYEFGTKGGLLKTTDEGATWAAAESGLTSRLVLSLAVDPQSPSTLYAGTTPDPFLPTAYSGVFKSENGGASWRPAPFDRRIPRVLSFR